MGKENQLLEAAASGNLVKVEVDRSKAPCDFIRTQLYSLLYRLRYFLFACGKRFGCWVCKHMYSAAQDFVNKFNQDQL